MGNPDKNKSLKGLGWVGYLPYIFVNNQSRAYYIQTEYCNIQLISWPIGMST